MVLKLFFRCEATSRSLRMGAALADALPLARNGCRSLNTKIAGSIWSITKSSATRGSRVAGLRDFWLCRLVPAGTSPVEHDHSNTFLFRHRQDHPQNPRLLGSFEVEDRIPCANQQFKVGSERHREGSQQSLITSCGDISVRTPIAYRLSPIAYRLLAIPYGAPLPSNRFHHGCGD